MGHFLLFVFGDNVDRQLAPFNEMPNSDAPYATFAFGRVYNPKGKWDYYVMGGRWSGYSKAKPGCIGTLGQSDMAQPGS